MTADQLRYINVAMTFTYVHFYLLSGSIRCSLFGQCQVFVDLNKKQKKIHEQVSHVK